MKKEISKAWPTSLVNKKTAFWIIGTLIAIFVLYLSNIRICAPCTYQYNNRDYSMACPEICASTPKWKILLFNLTGNNFDYKEKPAITKQY